MLKGKKSIYILLPINLLIWGFIGYKIYSALNEDDAFVPQEITVSKTIMNKEDSIPYTLSLNYEDPFLKEEPKLSKKQTNNNASSVQKPAAPVKKTVTPPPPVSIKEIKYQGLIQNKNNGVSTALITINSRSYIVKKGELVEGLIVMAFDSECLNLKEGKTLLKIKK